jgi:hypothetical protein
MLPAITNISPDNPFAGPGLQRVTVTLPNLAETLAALAVGGRAGAVTLYAYTQTNAGEVGTAAQAMTTDSVTLFADLDFKGVAGVWSLEVRTGAGEQSPPAQFTVRTGPVVAISDFARAMYDAQATPVTVMGQQDMYQLPDGTWRSEMRPNYGAATVPTIGADGSTVSFVPRIFSGIGYLFNRPGGTWEFLPVSRLDQSDWSRVGISVERLIHNEFGDQGAFWVASPGGLVIPPPYAGELDYLTQGAYVPGAAKVPGDYADVIALNVKLGLQSPTYTAPANPALLPPIADPTAGSAAPIGGAIAPAAVAPPVLLAPAPNNALLWEVIGAIALAFLIL